MHETLAPGVAASFIADVGPTSVVLTVGYSGARLTQSHVADGAPHRRTWTHDSVLDLELITTRQGQGPLAPGMAIDGFLGAVWRVAAKRDCPPLTISASAAPYEGSPHSGEHLECLSIEADSWCMSIGGYDDDFIAQCIGSRFPASWSGLLLPETWGGRYGASFPTPSTLSWVLPGLGATEHFDLHLAIAWLNAPPTPTNALSTWFAVDTTTQRLLRGV